MYSSGWPALKIRKTRIAGEKSSFLQSHEWCPPQQAFRKLLCLKASGGLPGQAESMETLCEARESFPGLNQDGRRRSATTTALPGRCQPSEIREQWFLRLAAPLSAWLSPPHQNPIIGQRNTAAVGQLPGPTTDQGQGLEPDAEKRQMSWNRFPTASKTGLKRHHASIKLQCETTRCCPWL